MNDNMKEYDESQLYNPMDDHDDSVEDSESYEINLAEVTFYEPEKNLRIAIVGGIVILLFCVGVYIYVKMWIGIS